MRRWRYNFKAVTLYPIYRDGAPWDDGTMFKIARF
jgi:hypothetical protein